MNDYHWWWIQCPTCSLERDHDHLPRTWLDTGSGIRFWVECHDCDETRDTLLAKQVEKMAAMGLISKEKVRETLAFVTKLMGEM